MRSYGIRNIPDLPKMDFVLYNSKKDSTNHANDPFISCALNNGPIAINNIQYRVYDCVMNKSRVMEICAAGTIYNTFEEITRFTVLYCESTHLTIVEENSQLAVKFFNLLAKEYNQNLTVNNFNYDFNVLRTMNSANILQLWFKNHSTIVKNKYFQGNRIDQDTEALNALTGDNATYISCNIDIASQNNNLARHIGLAKKGAITIVNPCDPNINSNASYRILLLDIFNTLRGAHVIL